MVEVAKPKKWYQSKTKVGAVLIGLGAIIGTVGGVLSGTIDITAAIPALMTEIGIVAAIFGVRDLPLLNQK